MQRNDPHIETLKDILENIHQPARLDPHPWAASLVVQQACREAPELLEKSPGHRLIAAMMGIFRQMMPASPPRQGKRLDTRWGEFGILAAMYFAPYAFGEKSPGSLRDAWENLDRSILLFVFGQAEGMTDEEKEAYKLAGGEKIAAPSSTLSDWHRNGLQHLLEMLTGRETHLARLHSMPAVIGADAKAVKSDSNLSPGRKSPKRKKKSKWFWITAGLLLTVLLGLMAIAGFRGYRLYQQALLVRADLYRIQAIVDADDPLLDRFDAMGPEIEVLKQDYEALRQGVDPYLGLGPFLAWVPTYGGDLESVQDLVILADSLIACADMSFQAVSPYIDELGSSGFDPVRLTEILVAIQPQLIAAQEMADQAVAARERLDVERLSPRVQNLILEDIDPLLPLLQDGLTVAVEAPRLLGASDEGPKSYLLLVQNEDELRPTGGFITSVGTVLIQNGEIREMSFQDSGAMDDWTKPYPGAPWQLKEYMNSQVLVLRDTNWFTNYPTAALYAETLYSYVSDHSVDGVIAFDQHVLVELLTLTGPLDVEEVDYPIDADNVIAYMRTEKTRSEDELTSGDWTSKEFIQPLADALITRFYTGDIPMEQWIPVMFRIMNEHHVLLQLDAPGISSVLSRYRWDGAIRTEASDFLMVVDSNIGFNKTNAVVGYILKYEVDLTIPEEPVGALTVIHINNAEAMICKHWDKIRLTMDGNYPIHDCYWSYLRVYLPAGTQLLDSVTQDVPGYWMINDEDVPAHVDILDEGIPGVQAFGTLMVVPGQETAQTYFRFALPPGVLSTDDETDQTTYRLLVQKQPGTIAVPITFRVVIPEGATIVTMPVGAVSEGGSVRYEADLRTDLRFEVVFTNP